MHDHSKVFIFVSIAPRSNSHIGSTNTRNSDGYGCNLKVHETTIDVNTIFTARKRSRGKVMFSQVSV